MPSSYNITDIAYSEALSGTLPTVAASARPVSLNRVLRSDLGWIDTLHVIYIIYLYIFVVLMEADTFVWDFDLTIALRHLEVLKNHYVTIRKAMKSEKAGRSGSETRESTKSPHFCWAIGAYILDWGHHSHHREATGSHRAYCWEPLGCIQNSKCHVEIFKLHNLRFGQDGAERGLFGRYFVLVIPFFQFT